ncbi:hypothetical protein Fraau_0255 [Frateuria aurantia DSM 6220]|uniref:Uncharacterized protein n=1 Tax=Frateuria aurantia (strain ATCC 33424 / DSM 6220 / KCTC 2777 / LMG 1558 / NBRC 3245 / NCIMB 13370) TaxID=767434 RepID=H8L2B6_FRAAD|nr:hypothetical protein Fraau_0255 [Frateuria aurantia DSM 6220]
MRGKIIHYYHAEGKGRGFSAQEQDAALIDQ